MKNSAVVDKFLNGEVAYGSNLKSTGTELINYSTVIAKKVNNLIFLNNQHYSQTTSIHQNRLRRMVPANRLKEVEAADIN